MPVRSQGHRGAQAGEPHTSIMQLLTEEGDAGKFPFVGDSLFFGKGGIMRGENCTPSAKAEEGDVGGGAMNPTYNYLPTGESRPTI